MSMLLNAFNHSLATMQISPEISTMAPIEVTTGFFRLPRELRAKVRYTKSASHGKKSATQVAATILRKSTFNPSTSSARTSTSTKKLFALLLNKNRFFHIKTNCFAEMGNLFYTTGAQILDVKPAGPAGDKIAKFKYHIMSVNMMNKDSPVAQIHHVIMVENHKAIEHFFKDMNQIDCHVEDATPARNSLTIELALRNPFGDETVAHKAHMHILATLAMNWSCFRRFELRGLAPELKPIGVEVANKVRANRFASPYYTLLEGAMNDFNTSRVNAQALFKASFGEPNVHRALDHLYDADQAFINAILTMNIVNRSEEGEDLRRAKPDNAWNQYIAEWLFPMHLLALENMTRLATLEYDIKLVNSAQVWALRIFRELSYISRIFSAFPADQRPCFSDIATINFLAAQAHRMMDCPTHLFHARDNIRGAIQLEQSDRKDEKTLAKFRKEEETIEDIIESLYKASHSGATSMQLGETTVYFTGHH